MPRIRRMAVSVSSPEFESFVRSLPATFDDLGKTLYDKRNTVRSVILEGKLLAIKRYKRPNLIQRVAYTFFRKSKAERAYLYAGMMLSRGIGTPSGLAYVETREGLLMADSYFVSEFCGLPQMSKLLRRPDFDRHAANQLAAFLVELHEKGVLHGDINLSNILYEKSPSGRYRFSLIDTNRSLFKNPTRRECLDNLTRLTHDRPLMAHVMARYASLRGWNAGQTVSEMNSLLDDFERRHERKVRLKRLLRGK